MFPSISNNILANQGFPSDNLPEKAQRTIGQFSDLIAPLQLTLYEST